MEAIKKIKDLFINNIPDIIVVITFIWICTTITCFVVYYVFKYIEKINIKLKKVENQSEKDWLTGLNNSKSFKILLDQSMENAILKKGSISVLVIDIDFFKKVNDIYGNLAVDSILKSLACILSGACGKLDGLGRLERDKFSIVLYKCSNNQAIEIAECIRAVIEKYPFVLPKGKIIYITVSIGVATYTDTIGETEDILSLADKALHNAKKAGKNKVCSI